MTKGLKLHDVLKRSYASKEEQKKGFHNKRGKGYDYDEDLSNDNQQVYYNKKKKKLLVSVAGTHNLSDVGTDAYLAMGHLKDTNRYKEAENVLNKAKSKYGVDSATVVGHSLGGSISQYIAGSKDKAITLDKGATIGQKTRSNENAYRTKGDAVSLLNANSTRMTTLDKPNNKPKTWIGAIGSAIYNTPKMIVEKGLNTATNGLYGVAKSALEAHNVDNIKDENIFV
jgi:hypothetical protein